MSSDLFPRQTLNYRLAAGAGGRDASGAARARAANEWYVEPAWAVELFLAAELFEGTTLDPACGAGTIPKAFRARGWHCEGSDLVDRGGGWDTRDFLDRALPVTSYMNIVTNPPYGRGLTARAFVERGIEVAWGKVAVLVNEKFLFAQSRHELFTRGGEFPLARVYCYSTRPSMPPGDLLAQGAIAAEGGSMNYCWMVWKRGHKGPPTTHWLLRRNDGTK